MNHNAAHFGPNIELINELWSQANLLSFYCFHKLGQKRRKLKKLPKTGRAGPWSFVSDAGRPALKMNWNKLSKL